MRSLSRRNARPLYSESRKGTLITLEIERGADGKLVISGHDCGNAPLAFWGDLDYEYWYVLDTAAERRLIQALNRSPARNHRRRRRSAETLLRSAFDSGRFTDPSDLRHFMEQHDINFATASYV